MERLVRRVAVTLRPTSTSRDELGSGTADTRKAKSELALLTVPFVEIFRKLPPIYTFEAAAP